jgi:hypothetical protein
LLFHLCNNPTPIPMSTARLFVDIPFSSSIRTTSLLYSSLYFFLTFVSIFFPFWFTKIISYFFVRQVGCRLY